MYDKNFFAERKWQEQKDKELLAIKISGRELVQEVSSLEHHITLNRASVSTLKKLFEKLPALSYQEIDNAVQLFSELPNGTYRFVYQNLFHQELLRKRSTATSVPHTPNTTTPMDWEPEEVVPFSHYIYIDNKKGQKWTFPQVDDGAGLDHFGPEALSFLIQTICQNRGIHDEDWIADAIVELCQMFYDDGVDRNRSPQYNATVAVNRMLNEKKKMGRAKRRSVETSTQEELNYIDVSDHYGNFYEWYESLTKNQKITVDSAIYKIEKGQKIGQALRKRLQRIPQPVMGETVLRFGKPNLREEYEAMRLRRT